MGKGDYTNFPISEHSLKLAEVGEKYCDVPGKFTVVFTADGKKYFVSVKVISKTIVYNGKQRKSKSNLCLTEVTVNGVKGYGFTEFEYRNVDRTDDIPKAMQFDVIGDLQPEKLSSKERTALVLPLSSRAARCPDVSGGKGSHLSQLMDVPLDGVGIPRGLVVTVAAFDLLLKDNRQIFEALDDADFERCRTEIMSTALPVKVEQQLVVHMQAAFGEQWSSTSLAVRSSAVGEDSETASAAGQMETILGVEGFANICSAVKKCWASQFTLSTSYHKQRGGRHESKMAVVVQKMVSSDVSGVMFTCNPMTGDPSQMSINANYGLGESVVSGEVEPDTIIINRTGNGNFAVDSIQIGSKAKRTSLVGILDVEESNGLVIVDQKDSETCCLSPSQIQQLCSAALRIEELFGNPRDIEWAFCGDKLHILQARPITTTSIGDELSLTHEFDTPIRSDDDFLTTANVGEVFAGAITPLGLSFVNNALERSMQYSLMKHNLHFAPSVYANVPTVISRNHGLLNMTQLWYREHQPKAARLMSELGVLGRPIDNSVVDEQQAQKQKEKSLSTSLYGIFSVYRLIREVPLLAAEASEICDKRDHFPDHVEGSAQIYQEIVNCSSDYFKVAFYHIAVSGLSSIAHIMVGSVLYSENLDQAMFCSDIAKILSNCSGVLSADVPHSIENLADVIRKSGDSEEFAKMQPQDALKWLDSNPAAGQAFSTFLKIHGHRCLHEIDLLEPPWKEQPLPLIQLLQSRLIHMRDVVREGYRRLAKSLTDESKLPSEELIFYTTHYELSQLIHENNLAVIDRARHRRRLRQSVLRELSMPEVCRGYPVNDKFETEENLSTGLSLKGTPVSLGKVKATARVCVTLEDAEHIQVGDILIARSTDIAWSVFFPLLSGVVTELGGLLSHGAVVAREYGLPCLVSAKGACDFFTSGEAILLDARLGTVSKLQDPEEI